MSEQSVSYSFIWKWLEQKVSEPGFDQAIIEAIEQNLGGVNNENLDEAGLLQTLVEIADRMGENARN